MLVTAVQKSDSVAHIHTHIYYIFKIFFFIKVYHRVLNIVLCAIVGPCGLSIPYRKLTSANPNLPLHPSLNPSPLATTSLFSMWVIPFHRYIHLCHILDSTYM